MKRKKYVVLLILILAVGVALGYYILNGQKSTINQGSLSERSRNYLEKKATTDGSSDLKYIQLTGTPEGASGQRFTVGECFSIQIPFIVDNSRQKEDECHLYVSTSRPDGSITAFMQNGTINDFDSVPGVSLRRIEKDKYKETSLKVNNRVFLGFKNTKELEETYFYYTPNSSFTITFNMHGQEVAGEVKATLESLTFLK